MVLYVIFVMIILLNLIIARMSSTHEKINDKSFEQWSMVMAKNVQDCLLINEKVCMCLYICGFICMYAYIYAVSVFVYIYVCNHHNVCLLIYILIHFFYVYIQNNPLCMLPPPFNAICTAVYPLDYWAKWSR